MAMVNNRSMGLVITMVVLIGSVSLLQLHGIIFWQEKVGTHGWAWSVLLEVVALWLWYKPSISFRILALVASILTLAGPVYQVAKPSFIASYEVGSTVVSNEAALDALTIEKERLQSQLVTYQENSSKRTGWLAPIREANARLIEIDSEIIRLQKSTDKESQWFFSWAILMEVASLILFQIVAVLSITSISRKVREMETNALPGNSLDLMETSMEIGLETQMETEETERETPLKSKMYESDSDLLKEEILSTAQADFPLLAEMENREKEIEVGQSIDPVAVLENLESYLAAKNMNFKEFGVVSGVSAKELSFLRNHKKRIEAGERTVSVPALEKINSVIFE